MQNEIGVNTSLISLRCDTRQGGFHCPTKNATTTCFTEKSVKLSRHNFLFHGVKIGTLLRYGWTPWGSNYTPFRARIEYWLHKIVRRAIRNSWWSIVRLYDFQLINYSNEWQKADSMCSEANLTSTDVWDSISKKFPHFLKKFFFYFLLEESLAFFLKKIFTAT